MISEIREDRGGGLEEVDGVEKKGKKRRGGGLGEIKAVRQHHVILQQGLMSLFLKTDIYYMRHTMFL